MGSLLKSKNVKNAGWIIGEQIFQMLVSFVIGIISARYLGPSNYGALNYTASFVVFFTSVASLGKHGVVVKKLIVNPEQEGLYLGSSMIFRVVSSLISSVLILLMVYLLDIGDVLKVYLAGLQSIQLVFQAVNILDAWFQRHLKAKFVSLAKMLACIVVSCYKVYLLIAAKSVVWFAFSNSLTSIIIAVVLFLIYRKQGGQKFSYSFDVGREVLCESWHFIISGLMVAIYGQIGKIIVGQYMDDMDVGFYTMAGSLCAMWLFIPIAIINSMQPTIIEYKHQGNEMLYSLRLHQLYSLLIWLCILVSVVVWIVGEYIVLFLYGEEYMPAVAPLQILIWSEVFSVLGTARGIWILSESKNKYVKYYLAIGAVFSVILNFILIPKYGIIGASIVTVLTQIVTSMIAPLFFKATRIHTKIIIDSFLLKWLFDKNKVLK